MQAEQYTSRSQIYGVTLSLTLTLARLSSTPYILALVLAQISFESEDLPRQTLKLINEVLCTLYPPKAEQLNTALEIMRRLRNAIRGTSAPTLCAIIQILQPGICAWIEDESEVLLEAEYNDAVCRPHVWYNEFSIATPQVIALYTDALDVLRALPPSAETLSKMTLFLASSFVRIPSPALGPLAFEKFWRATYHKHECISGACPPRIKACLKGFVDAFGGDLIATVDMTDDTDSPVRAFVVISRRLSESLSVSGSRPSQILNPNIKVQTIRLLPSRRLEVFQFTGQ